MVDHTAFLAQGFRLVGYALAETVSRANLHLKPDTLTRAVKRRCMAEFRVLATLIRRLIFLMALSIELPDVRHGPVKSGIVSHSPVKSGMDGVEDVTASFGPQPAGFRLAPGLSGPCPDALRTAPRPAPGPVSAAPAIARWAALHRILKDPERAARRLARTIRRWRAGGEPKPLVVPMAHGHRLRPELGLVAGLLPQLLNTQMQDWPDTG